MKGIVGYIFAIAIVSILTIASFFLLGELLSRETSVSMISSAVSRSINEMEFSKIYFKKYYENEINNLRASGLTNEEIIESIRNLVADLELENSRSNFMAEEVYMNDSRIIIVGKINSFAESKDFRIKTEYGAKFII